MVQKYIALKDQWGLLRQSEEAYTQHMIDSEINFNIVGVNAKNKSVTYTTDMKPERGIPLSSDKPTTLYFVKADETPLIMDILGAGAITLPSGIWMNTNLKRDVKRFTNDTAHEMYHEWERDRWGGWVMSSTWYLVYW